MRRMKLPPKMFIPAETARRNYSSGVVSVVSAVSVVAS